MENVHDVGSVEIQLSTDTIWEVWSKGEIFAGNDPVFWRRDVCGAWIFRSHYDRKDSEYGWVVDRIELLKDDNMNAISNLRPMQWENTKRKEDGTIECHVTSTGIHNDKPIEDASIESLESYFTDSQDISKI